MTQEKDRAAKSERAMPSEQAMCRNCGETVTTGELDENQHCPKCRDVAPDAATPAEAETKTESEGTA